MIFKWILLEKVTTVYDGFNSPVAGYCKNGNEPSG